jgi:hypothetical protein
MDGGMRLVQTGRVSKQPLHGIEEELPKVVAVVLLVVSALVGADAGNALVRGGGGGGGHQDVRGGRRHHAGVGGDRAARGGNEAGKSLGEGHGLLLHQRKTTVGDEANVGHDLEEVIADRFDVDQIKMSVDVTSDLHCWNGDLKG